MCCFRIGTPCGCGKKIPIQVLINWSQYPGKTGFRAHLSFWYCYSLISQILLLSAFVIISLYNSYFNPTAEVDVPRPDHTERVSFFLISTITLWLFASLVFVFSLSTVSDRIGKVWNVLVSNFFFKFEIAFIYYYFYHIFLHNQDLQEQIQQALR